MQHSYDPENIFARILRGEIPNDTVLETEHALAFRDIRPQAPVHVLVIPKVPYCNARPFLRGRKRAEISGVLARRGVRSCESDAACEAVSPSSPTPPRRPAGVRISTLLSSPGARWGRSVRRLRRGPGQAGPGRPALIVSGAALRGPSAQGRTIDTLPSWTL